jgi:hypothetical protein
VLPTRDFEERDHGRQEDELSLRPPSWRGPDELQAAPDLAGSGPDVVEGRVISRRGFLSAAGVTGVGLAISTATGCDGLPGASSSRRNPSKLGAVVPAQALPPPPTPVGGPRRSDEMVEMIGVLIHLTGPPDQSVSEHRSDFLYSNYRDVGPSGGPGWLALLAAAGFRHVRCDTGGSITPTSDGSQAFALETMRMLDTTKPAHSPTYRQGIDKVYLSDGNLSLDLPILRALGGRIWMIEGPNESWAPDGKFLPSYASDGQTIYTCLHAVAPTRAIAPADDPTRWQVCNRLGAWSARIQYQPGDLVTYGGHLWVSQPNYSQPAGTPPGDAWWDLTAWNLPTSFPSLTPGVYKGYGRAGEVGVAWGEYFGDLIKADDAVSAQYWSSAGGWGRPVRVATPSEGGVDIFSFWDLPGDVSLIRRYGTSMPGGSTNLHLYEGGQPEDMTATLASAIVTAQAVLPNYPIYLGEVGQATYPTDDALALGTQAEGAVPAMVISQEGQTFPADMHGRPMPGTTTGRFGAELAQAQKLLRSWAELFRSAPAGSRFTVYELLNEPFNGFDDYAGRWGYPVTGGPYFDYNRSEGNFGLIRSDFTAKPAYFAIANAVALLGDSGDQGFFPQDLAFSLTRPNGAQRSAEPSLGRADEVRSVVTQASNGDFRIIVYYSNVRATEELLPGMSMNQLTVPRPTEPITLTLLDGVSGRLAAYNTQVGSRGPVQSVDNGTSISWTLTADLWIVTVHPTSG